MKIAMVKRDNPDFRILTEEKADGQYKVIFMKGSKGKLVTEIWDREDIDAGFIDLVEE